MNAGNRPPSTVFIIAGPTAGGKSGYALKLAAERGGVIINADSMQIYDALPILTAQPSKNDRAAAPHRLYGVLDPAVPCSAADWRDKAIAEIDAALAQNMTPMIVGGTGFYIKALTEGLSPIPAVDPAVRDKATARQKELGNPAFHGDLAKKDPAMAARLHPNDTQRLIRAWEVIEATGKSLAHWQSLPPAPPPRHYNFDITLIMPERDTLYDRCNRRFDAMIEQGALDEARDLDRRIRDGLVPAGALIAHALGFHPLQAFLHDRTGLDDALEQAKTETRQYAKRQVTWFTNQVRPHRIIRAG